MCPDHLGSYTHFKARSRTGPRELPLYKDQIHFYTSRNEVKVPAGGVGDIGNTVASVSAGPSVSLWGYCLAKISYAA